MSNKADQAALAETLEQAGVGNVSIPTRGWLNYGNADGSNNDAVRLAANDLLLELARENRVGRCIHITGEMRALSDPFHRRICAEIRKRTENKFSVLYYIPKEYRTSAEGIATWNAEKWKGSGWVDRLSAFNIIGNDIVDVYAYDTLDKIQYSVFGDRYILLQGRHEDLTKLEAKAIKRRKKVWLLESEKLHKSLCEAAQEMTTKAEVVPDMLFKKFTTSVHGATSREILRRLLAADGAASKEKILDDDLRYFDEDAEGHLSALKTIGFVTCDRAGNLQITVQGRQYHKETQINGKSSIVEQAAAT